MTRSWAASSDEDEKPGSVTIGPPLVEWQEEGREPTELEKKSVEFCLNRHGITLEELPCSVKAHLEFTDHAGNAGLSIYYGERLLGQRPPIPKWSWQVYVTNGMTLGSDQASKASTLAFCKKVQDLLGEADGYWRNFNGVPRFRFDFHFLPPSPAATGAEAGSRVPCAMHYRAEKQFRRPVDADDGTAATALPVVPDYACSYTEDHTANWMVVVDTMDPETDGVYFVGFDNVDPPARTDDSGIDEGTNGLRRALGNDGPNDDMLAVQDEMDGLAKLNKTWKEWDKQFWREQKLLEREWKRSLRSKGRPNY